MIEIGIAKPEDFANPPPYRCLAYCVKKDGRVIGLGGFGFPADGPVFIWSELTDELRALPLTLHRLAKKAIRHIEGMGVRVMYATTDVGFEAAERWVEHLGFVPTGEVVDGKKVHVWHAR